MKISKGNLRRLIKEELARVLREQDEERQDPLTRARTATDAEKAALSNLNSAINDLVPQMDDEAVRAVRAELKRLSGMDHESLTAQIVALHPDATFYQEEWEAAADGNNVRVAARTFANSVVEDFQDIILPG